MQAPANILGCRQPFARGQHQTVAHSLNGWGKSMNFPLWRLLLSIACIRSNNTSDNNSSRNQKSDVYTFRSTAYRHKVKEFLLRPSLVKIFRACPPTRRNHESETCRGRWSLPYMQRETASDSRRPALPYNVARPAPSVQRFCVSTSLAVHPSALFHFLGRRSRIHSPRL